VLKLARALEEAHLPITTVALLLRARDFQVFLSKRTIQKAVSYLSERAILAPTGERQGRALIYSLQGGGRTFAIQPDALIRAAWVESAPYTSTGRAGAMSTGLDLNAAERPAGSEDAGHPPAPILGSDSIAHARTGGIEAPLGEPQPPTPQGSVPSVPGTDGTVRSPVRGFAHGICELCGQPGPLTKDSDGYYACSVCLNEPQPSMMDEPQPPGPQEGGEP
jgi:hypothetical protein